MLENSNNLKQSQKVTPKWIPRNDFILKGFASCGAFNDSNRFCDQKWSLSAPKVRSRLEKGAKNDTKELSECENELQK